MVGESGSVGNAPGVEERRDRLEVSVRADEDIFDASSVCVGTSEFQASCTRVLLLLSPSVRVAWPMTSTQATAEQPTAFYCGCRGNCS